MRYVVLGNNFELKEEVKQTNKPSITVLCLLFVDVWRTLPPFLAVLRGPYFPLRTARLFSYEFTDTVNTKVQSFKPHREGRCVA